MIEPFLSVREVERLLAADSADVVVCDVRSRMAGVDPVQSFAEGHLPGALLVDLDEVLSDPPGGDRGRHPLPTSQRFAAALGELGIGDESTVVAYDDRGGAFAGRLVWMLRIIGQPAGLLDGGAPAWREAGGSWTTAPTVREPVVRRRIDWPPGALADADDVADHIASGGVVIDSREAVRYRGETEPIDAIAGHVPGAINRFFGDHLVDDRLDRERAREGLAPLAGDAGSIVYCGSGVTACHNALAAEAVGLGRPRVFVGSWSGWSADPARPVATGAS